MTFLLCITLVPVTAIFAETESELERFEKSATRLNDTTDSGEQPHSHEETSYRESRDYSPDDENQEPEDEFTSKIFELVVYIVAAPGIYSWQRVTVPPARNTAEEDRIMPRILGDKTIPFVRIDGTYNRVNSHINAVSQRAEIGFGPFGYVIRSIHYDDSDPTASLDIKQYHFLYRMSLEDNAEMDIGFGEYEISGQSRNSGESYTVSLSIYPTEHLGVEFRPTWANVNGNDISDHELAISYGERFWSVRAGYHWLKAPDSDLNGPFIGFSLRL